MVVLAEKLLSLDASFPFVGLTFAIVAGALRCRPVHSVVQK